MTGEDTVVVRECEDAFLEFLYQRGVVSAREVGTSNAEMEQRITSEDSLLLR